MKRILVKGPLMASSSLFPVPPTFGSFIQAGELKPSLAKPYN
jgi:hypothetical protein